jgi:hypothetical protein
LKFEVSLSSKKKERIVDRGILPRGKILVMGERGETKVDVLTHEKYAASCKTNFQNIHTALANAPALCL